MLASVWLQLQEPQHGIVRELIASLAAEHATVPFQPHLTVCGGADLDPARWDAAAEYVRRSAPLPLSVKQIGISTSPEVSFRAVIIDVENTPEMRAFRDEIARICGAAIIAQPHISLLYTIDERGQRVNWAADAAKLSAIAADATERLAATEFVLDDPVVVAPERQWANIRSWKVVKSL
ncbi:MAG TPA: hypothetical protein VHO95_05585 [Candidatus Dormibacteraeota bacterium]|jgi:2'-5' RNA ligase|nr:hypothetical protein [Candidatus Dormibacteraeota bacterium]